MSLIMVFFPLVQFALLVGASQGGKPNPRSRHMNVESRTVDKDEILTSDVPVTVLNEADPGVKASGGDLSKIENMFSQINQNLMCQRFQPFNGCGCGNGCGNGSGNACGNSCACTSCCGQWPNDRPASTQNITQSGRQGLSEEHLMLELKKGITELRQRISTCCKADGARNIKGLRDDLATLVTPLTINQKAIQADSSNLVKAVVQLIEGQNAKMKKQTEEWQTMASQFQASQERFRMSMEQQLEKLADVNPCPIIPKLKKVGRKIESDQWIITQSPIQSVSAPKRAWFDG